jgi:carbonic anhydrase
MDARLDVYALLGLSPGEAHVIRNAGGIVTEDAIRSLAISQHLLGTREVMLVHHTQCGLQQLDDEAFAADLERSAGVRPAWRAGGFPEVVDDVRRSITELKGCPFLPFRDQIRGFVFDVSSGRLSEVAEA